MYNGHFESSQVKRNCHRHFHRSFLNNANFNVWLTNRHAGCALSKYGDSCVQVRVTMAALASKWSVARSGRMVCPQANLGCNVCVVGWGAGGSFSSVPWVANRVKSTTLKG